MVSLLLKVSCLLAISVAEAFVFQVPQQHVRTAVVSSSTHTAQLRQSRREAQHMLLHTTASPLRRKSSLHLSFGQRHGTRSSGNNSPRRVGQFNKRGAGSSAGMTCSMSSTPPGGVTYPTATGPGTGVIDMRFRELKTGGFKVFLLFFLLGQGRAADNDVPFQVRDTPQGIRVLIGDDASATEWQGVLDLYWGTDPQPFFRVDRIDPKEVVPYPGELYILNKLVDAIIDVNGERAVNDEQKLFLFPEEDCQLSAHKAKIASLAAM